MNKKLIKSLQFVVIIGFILITVITTLISFDAFGITTKCYTQTLVNVVLQLPPVLECLDNNIANHETRITTLENAPAGSGNATILNDLGDVVIISPSTNQILKYDGAKWTNANLAGGGNATILNDLGDVIIQSVVNGQVLRYNGTHWINSTPLTYENNTASNLGSVGEGIFAQKSGIDLQFKKILAGTGITLSSNGTRITIDNSLPDNTTCTNLGSGAQIYKDGECNFRTLTNGTNTIIKQNANDISISSYMIGQVAGQVYFSLTKTNIGTTDTDIYISAFDEENQMKIDFSNVTYWRIIYQWDYVGVGTHNLCWVDVSNNANGLCAGGITSDRDPGDSNWQAIPSAFVNQVITIEWRGSSTTGTDDPIAKGYKIMVK